MEAFKNGRLVVDVMSAGAEFSLDNKWYTMLAWSSCSSQWQNPAGLEKDLQQRQFYSRTASFYEIWDVIKLVSNNQGKLHIPYFSIHE